MRRHASGIGCGARGRGMNATPQAPGRRRGTRKQVYAVCANANCFAGGTTPPREELADGGPLRLARGSKDAATRKGQASQRRRQGETVRQKARPGAVWTSRWRALDLG